MKTAARLIALPLLLVIAGCGDKKDSAQGERKTAAGDVLGGSISDDMLPLATVTSQSPPLGESGDDASDQSSGEKESPAADAATPAVEASEAPAPDGEG